MVRRLLATALTVCVIACGGDGDNEGPGPGPGGDGGQSGGDNDGGEDDGGVPSAVDQFCSALAAECDSRCDGSFDSVQCDGPLSGSFDNVEVEGEDCDLSDALVTGNVVAKSGAQVTVGPTVFVCGDLQADEASEITVRGQGGRVDVCGSLQVTKVDEVVIARDIGVRGSAKVVESSDVTFEGATVCGDADFDKNEDLSVGSGELTTIVGNCSASENSTAAFGNVDIFGDNQDCN